MADNNILRPVFGLKKIEQPKTASPSLPESSPELMGNLLREMLKDKIQVQAAEGGDAEKIDMSGFLAVLETRDIEKLLGRLVQRHEGKIREYKSLVESYSDAELREWLKDPKDSDLQRKPYFFHALIDELTRRFHSLK